ncbi:hypothetical protein G9274_002269 [Stenotrophomonas rhizophila]|nr:hypothetical protein G9274_002269 [Stenotrophomonas rhizophila]
MHPGPQGLVGMLAMGEVDSQVLHAAKA